MAKFVKRIKSWKKILRKREIKEEMNNMGERRKIDRQARKNECLAEIMEQKTLPEKKDIKRYECC